MQPVAWRFKAIGTHWVVELLAGDYIAEDVLGRVAARIEAFDKLYSRFRPDSLVTRMAAKAGTYTLPVDARRMLDTYEQLYEISGGAVTPLVGQALSDAGYDADYSLRGKPLQATPGWHDVISYAWPLLTLKRPALLDFGALGKGHLLDIIGRLLRRQGVTAYCVNAGGDIVCHGDERLDVALEDPLNPSQAVGVARLRRQALCGSAGNRRSWGNYHHIMHPHTLQSPRHLQAVWASAETALVADAISTALFFTPATALRPHFSFSYALIRADGAVERSDDFPGEFFA